MHHPTPDSEAPWRRLDENSINTLIVDLEDVKPSINAVGYRPFPRRRMVMEVVVPTLQSLRTSRNEKPIMKPFPTKKMKVSQN